MPRNARDSELTAGTDHPLHQSISTRSASGMSRRFATARTHTVTSTDASKLHRRAKSKNVGLMLCEIGRNWTRLADLCQIARGHRLMRRARVRQKRMGSSDSLPVSQRVVKRRLSTIKTRSHSFPVRLIACCANCVGREPRRTLATHDSIHTSGRPTRQREMRPRVRHAHRNR